MLYLGLGRYDSAEKLIRATLAEDKTQANMINLLGLTFHRQSRFGDALQEFKKSIKTNPEFIEATLNLVATLCDVGRYEEGRDLFEALTAKNRQHKQRPRLVLGRLANLHVESARAYEGVGMHQEAILEYKKALGLFPAMPDVRVLLGRLYIRMREWDRAETEVQEALKEDPTCSEAYALAGFLAYKKGKPSDARDFWLKAQQADPSDATSKAYLRIAEGVTVASS
jgi:tetratricopeptide (TPR) repeat protein